MTWLDVRQKQVAVQQNTGQQIVEVVCNASGQAADGFQSFGLPQALVSFVVPGKIFLHRQRRVGMTVCTRHPPHCPPHRPRSVRGLGFDLKVFELTSKKIAKQSFRLIRIFGLNEVPKANRRGYSALSAKPSLQSRT